MSFFLCCLDSSSWSGPHFLLSPPKTLSTSFYASLFLSSVLFSFLPLSFFFISNPPLVPTSVSTSFLLPPFLLLLLCSLTSFLLFLFSFYPLVNVTSRSSPLSALLTLVLTLWWIPSLEVCHAPSLFIIHLLPAPSSHSLLSVPFQRNAAQSRAGFQFQGPDSWLDKAFNKAANCREEPCTVITTHSCNSCNRQVWKRPFDIRCSKD